ncbi:MAG TPA: TraR/DksA family transcriptional regulator [Candidatus Babeliales bacterium]|nr:TraR/DksA family transcriptional regulator [Candidatus Babeliales bacterium]
MVNKKISGKIEDIKKGLLERKVALEQDLIRLSNEKLSDDQVQDVGDQAFTLTMEALRSSIQNSENEEYNRIIKALEAIEDGTYGICVDCSGEISEKRLMHYPNASRCIACQEKAELVG